MSQANPSTNNNDRLTPHSEKNNTLTTILSVLGVVLGGAALAVALFRNKKSGDSSNDFVKSYTIVKKVSQPTVDAGKGNSIIDAGIGSLIDNLPRGTVLLAATLNCNISIVGGIVGSVMLGTASKSANTSTVTQFSKEEQVTLNVGDNHIILGREGIGINGLPEGNHKHSLYLAHQATADDNLSFPAGTTLTFNITLAAPTQLP